MGKVDAMATNKQYDWLVNRVNTVMWKEMCNLKNFEDDFFHADWAMDKVWKTLINYSVITDWDWCLDMWDDHHELVEFTFHDERFFIDVNVDRYYDYQSIHGWNVGKVEERSKYYFIWNR